MSAALQCQQDAARFASTADVQLAVERHLGVRASNGLRVQGEHESLIQAGTPTGRPKVTPADLAAAHELLADCLFRMFEPHEVAAGMAFPPNYIWQPPVRKKPISKRSLVRAAGNAVCPPCSRDVMAIVVESFGRAA